MRHRGGGGKALVLGQTSVCDIMNYLTLSFGGSVWRRGGSV